MQRRPRKLLAQVREAIRLKHYSIGTEETYVSWIKRYILFHNKQPSREMGVPEIEAFLTHLAVGQNVTASTQNQAISPLLFLYRKVLKQATGGPIEAARAKQPEQLLTILRKEEVAKARGHLSGTHRLMSGLIYGSGLRE